MKGIHLADMTWLTEDSFQFSQQMGLRYLRMGQPAPEDGEVWSYEELADATGRARDHGLEIVALESGLNLTLMTGQPGKERQLECYIRCLENAKRAGIPIVGYHFMADTVWRTSFSAPGRAGTKFTAYHDATAQTGYRESIPTMRQMAGVPEEKLWENYAYFCENVLPEAQRIGVKLAMHPDDPPVPQINGVHRLFYSVDQFKRAWDISGHHPNWGFDLCLGSLSELEGERTVLDMIEYFGPLGCIQYCHFRDVQGMLGGAHPTGYFQECFMGDGNYNPAKVLVALSRSGFDGYLIDDHVGDMRGDDPCHRRAHAREIGYMQGLICMADYLLENGKKA